MLVLVGWRLGFERIRVKVPGVPLVVFRQIPKVFAHFGSITTRFVEESETLYERVLQCRYGLGLYSLEEGIGGLAGMSS
jgi:hypothetical protein